MQAATIIYPHQLFKESPALDRARPVYLVEESLLLTYNPIHIQKLMLHKLSMDACQATLEDKGYTVTRLTVTDYPTTTSVFDRITKDGYDQVHITDTTDHYLEQAITESGIERVWYDSPLFILPKTEAVERYRRSKRRMATFYKQLRQDKHILVDSSGTPKGGKWSFDSDNRRKLPKGIALPPDITTCEHSDVTQAARWAATVQADTYGEARCWVPYTHADAHTYLHDFLAHRFSDFGTYEDALTDRSVRIFHSTLSPLLNIGLLTPTEVVDEALAYAKQHSTPLNSVEGFIRQILGWREFMRAAYECDGVTIRTKNFWQHTKPVPTAFWSGETTIAPIDTAIKRALAYGYNHHIERLMILGNFMLLSQIHPDAVYRWFMGMYLDAYDWVMVPNVYGMSQFAGGDLFVTKPYISGSNYIRKMSDYPAADWEELWTALYWNFIATHSDFFKSNHRLSMMPRMLEKMDVQKRVQHIRQARHYLDQNV